MKYPKEIFVADYFDIHDFYSKIYGEEKTIILIQCGSFHECYGTDFFGLDLIKIAEQLDIVCTKKSNKKPLSKSNPRMLGFPIHVVNNFIEKLCNLEFTVVVIDQVTEPPKPKREVTGIYSPATFVQKNVNYSISKSTYLTSIVIELIKSSSGTILFGVGITSYDLTTGYGSFNESYSTSEYVMLALDETIRFMETYPPREIVLYFNPELSHQINNLSYQDIISYLNLSHLNIYPIKDYSKYKKISSLEMKNM